MTTLMLIFWVSEKFQKPPGRWWISARRRITV